MVEQIFNPKSLAKTIAGREVGRGKLDKVIGRLENLTFDYSGKEAGKQVHEILTTISKSRVDPWSKSMRQQAQEVRKQEAQAYGGQIQGQFEAEMAKAVTDSEKAKIQKKYLSEMQPSGSRESLFAYENAQGKRVLATPLETTFGIAQVENTLFDMTRDVLTKKGKIKDPNKLSKADHAEIQKHIDSKLRSLGMNLLRGMVLPNPYGQVLVDKVLNDATKLLKLTNKVKPR